MKMIRAILADAQTVVREGLKYIIEYDKEIKVVGLAGNGIEAYELCGRVLPDIVLMDILMPVCDGIEATRLIKTNFESVKVLILSTLYDKEKAAKALENGADGYVLKDIGPDDLVRTIKNVSNGLKVVNENVFSLLIRNRNISVNKINMDSRIENLNLSEREMEIIRMIVYGKNNREIASEIYISEGRLKNILTEILEKAGLKDRTQLAVFAVKNNLV